MSNEWKIALREQLNLGLVAYTEGKGETPVTLELDFQEGYTMLSWEDSSAIRWYLTIEIETLIALAEAMCRM